ncbi:methyltransferase domain-containing protein [Eudoraea chungangensis]|uniref:methyltransferase domain-containing protein n=1 Tax=Eudoraea chungangensis TaxID=1481905 RepID=UPI0023ED7A08|nr:methyltransferase domain-containing protein [Eudoraea chungangensis]
MKTRDIQEAMAVDPIDLERRVKDMYKKVALQPEVTYHFEMGRELAESLGYPSKELDLIPKEAIESFAGVGYYFDFANLNKGEVVVDLGSGSGMDVFFAANQVGPSGEVIGIDMTEEQLQKSVKLGKDAGFKQLVFRKGYIEEVPVVSNCIDVVISNGVINLSSDKKRVFKEAARVLKEGGRLVLSDIVTEAKLPASISCNATLWAACIGGAMQVEDYKELIEEAGLKIMEVKENPYAFISSNAQGASKQYGIKSISLMAVKIA